MKSQPPAELSVSSSPPSASRPPSFPLFCPRKGRDEGWHHACQVGTSLSAHWFHCSARGQPLKKWKVEHTAALVANNSKLKVITAGAANVVPCPRVPGSTGGWWAGSEIGTLVLSLGYAPSAQGCHHRCAKWPEVILKLVVITAVIAVPIVIFSPKIWPSVEKGWTWESRPWVQFNFSTYKR